MPGINFFWDFWVILIFFGIFFKNLNFWENFWAIFWAIFSKILNFRVNFCNFQLARRFKGWFHLIS